MQQRDSLSVVIRFNQEIAFNLAPNATTTGDAYNVYKVLQQSPMYTAFASMYDQFKLDGAKVVIHQIASNATLQGVHSPMNVVTAWDRSGLSVSATNPNAYTQNVSFDAISQYSSAIVKPAMYGTFYTAVRSLYPTTLQEKGQWVSTNALSMVTEVGNQNFALDMPTSLIESGAYKFKPIFVMSLKTLNANGTAQAVQLAKFSFEWSIPVTFRGLRKLT